MPFVCGFVCGSKPRKKATGTNQKMDFRRADPTYVNFVPRTCADAIDLFNRHRNLGMTSDLYPECFVHCAKSLPDGELDKFHRFIVQPAGDISKGGEKATGIDVELEKERLQLLAEAAARDLQTQRTSEALRGVAALTIEEEKSDESMGTMSQDDEKTPLEPDYIKLTLP
jgi:hypothetical protein